MSQKHQFLVNQTNQKKSEEYWRQGSEEFIKKVKKKVLIVLNFLKSNFVLTRCIHFNNQRPEVFLKKSQCLYYLKRYIQCVENWFFKIN
jgi:hypothetical protein